MHVAAEFDGRLVGPLMQQWKRMAACNVQETQRPQDGRILARLAGKPGRVLDLRASFVPAAIGESVTVRLLDSSRVQLDLGAIALSPRVRERIEAALGRPWGVVLFTGPTGSGKTTVAYAALQRLAGPQVKVMSVEDPVEYLLPWVTQIPLRRDAGLTYEAAIRSILRSDPDVVYVAETTGAEVLAGVLSAALTGHLVLTTMHVDRAASALARMAELGAEPLAVAQATRLVLAQRLVRRLCPACAKPANLPVETVARARQMAAEGGLPPAEFGDAFRAAVGCPKCAGTGYRGRFAIMEALAPCAGLNEALQRRATAGEIERVAIAGGMVTLAADGLRRAAAGETTIEEALRVLGLPPSGARPAGGG
jgi:type II secretory ATPase GspE/PulE/Tfp pilus assembly ATPase PilB-like protein